MAHHIALHIKCLTASTVVWQLSPTADYSLLKFAKILLFPLVCHIKSAMSFNHNSRVNLGEKLKSLTSFLLTCGSKLISDPDPEFEK